MTNDDTHSQYDELIQLVSFSLGNEEFGIEILKVQEINRMAELTKVPQAPHYVEGIINLRGKVIPVIDLRKKFDLDSKEWDKNTRIVVCDVGGRVIGMIVDAVEEVRRIPRSSMEPPPSIVTSASVNYISGVAKLENHLLIFLDISKIASEIDQDGTPLEEQFAETASMENQH